MSRLHRAVIAGLAARGAELGADAAAGGGSVSAVARDDAAGASDAEAGGGAALGEALAIAGETNPVEGAPVSASRRSAAQSSPPPSRTAAPTSAATPTRERRGGSGVVEDRNASSELVSRGPRAGGRAEPGGAFPSSPSASSIAAASSCIDG